MILLVVSDLSARNVINGLKKDQNDLDELGHNIPRAGHEMQQRICEINLRFREVHVQLFSISSEIEIILERIQSRGTSGENYMLIFDCHWDSDFHYEHTVVDGTSVDGED
uniref:Uncharacterized protein n=1 Tax=Onchocerca volvulus TaxID=6282 RepID=A0A8R1TTK2_ONCVO